MIIEALHDFPRGDQQPAKDFANRENQTQHGDQLGPEIDVGGHWRSLSSCRQTDWPSSRISWRSRTVVVMRPMA